MQVDQYRGIKEEYTSEYRSQGSKFYGFLFPVSGIDNFNERIKTIKTQFTDATHVCSACVIGLDKAYQRFSDDGEPSNSSGRPILNALLSSKLSYVGCAVVRYYGGKKLGIPGLIEAYGGAAQLCIDSAKPATLTLKKIIVCSVDSNYAYLLYNLMSRKKLKYSTSSQGTFEITCELSMTSDLHKELEKISTLVIHSRK